MLELAPAPPTWMVYVPGAAVIWLKLAPQPDSENAAEMLKPMAVPVMLTAWDDDRLCRESPP